MFIKQVHAKMSAFDGGIASLSEKNIAEDLPILDFMDPEQDIVFSMSQYPGDECQPLVEAGSYVLRDQPIGKPKRGGAFIYSSVSGMVKEIRPIQLADGTRTQGIVVENDHQYTTILSPFEPQSFENLSLNEILGRIHYAGIAGMDPDHIPVHQKIEKTDPEKVHTILVSGVDLDPMESSRYRMVLEDPERVVKGLRILLHLFPLAKGKICISRVQTKAAEALKEHLTDKDKIRISLVSEKYPQGDDQLLVKTVAHKEIPEGGSASDLGILIIGCDTAIAISRAVEEGRPAERVIITLAGDCIKTPRTFRVRIGTSLQELLEQAGGMTKRPRRVIYGGLMRGKTVDSLDAPVTRSTTSLIVFSTKENNKSKEYACIRCNRCIDVCPLQLQPYRLKNAADSGNTHLFEVFHGSICTWCGCCSYVCPSGREIADSIRMFSLNPDHAEKKAKEEQDS